MGFFVGLSLIHCTGEVALFTNFPDAVIDNRQLTYSVFNDTILHTYTITILLACCQPRYTVYHPGSVILFVTCRSTLASYWITRMYMYYDVACTVLCTVHNC